jgi:hypothetical protein
MRRFLPALARLSPILVALASLTLPAAAQAPAPTHTVTTSAKTLALSQPGTCQPGWLPTFGDLGASVLINALTVFDDGSGPALYAAGSFATIAGVSASNIARWDGATWSALGSGVNGSVNALAVFDDGSGPALYAGGSFGLAGGVAARRVARWNGVTWSALGTGLNGGAAPAVIALAAFDDGSGPALFVGGLFATAGAVSAANIATWNGTSWSALGSGTDAIVRSFASFDDGSGAVLCVGGEFLTAGGVAMNRVGTWNGTSWAALGGGVANGGALGTSVKALRVFDDGNGPALYAGGGFLTAGTGSAPHIAKWNGTGWSGLASGFDKQVFAITVFDDGSGPALYASGSFATATGVPMNALAKWTGTVWSSLANGVSGGGLPSVNALAIFDDGGGPALFAGGNFTGSPAGDSHLAKWGGCSAPPTPWTDLGSGLAGASGVPQLNGLGDLVAGTPGSLGLANAAPSAVATLFVSTSSTPTSFKGGTLLTVPILLTLPLSSDALGELLLPWAAWPSGLSGVSLFFQFGIQDGAAVKGVALSNALRADVP